MKASERLEQIRRAHKSAEPKPAVNPAWTNTHRDLGFCLSVIESQAKALEEMEQVGWLHTYSDDEGTWKWLYKEKPAVSGGSLVPVFTVPQALASHSKEGEQG